MILVSRIDAAVLGFLDCECCGTGSVAPRLVPKPTIDLDQEQP